MNSKIKLEILSFVLIKKKSNAAINPINHIKVNCIMKISPIIETEDLLKIYKNSDILIFDVSNNKDAKINYEKEHLEGSYFVDINSQLADIQEDLSKGGRHPLPDITEFGNTLSKLGISKDSHIIVYDDKSGANAAARFWWMLKSVGHEKVQVLNGGLQAAKKYNFPMSSKTEVPEKTSEPYITDKWYLPRIEMNDIESKLGSADFLIVDVREKLRYHGKSEPIDPVAGHIPGAINIPFFENLDENGLFLKPELIKNKYRAYFAKFKTENIAIHCGSGVTACHSLLALDYAGMELPNLYVGSWSEWCRNGKQIGKS